MIRVVFAAALLAIGFVAGSFMRASADPATPIPTVCDIPAHELRLKLERMRSDMQTLMSLTSGIHSEVSTQRVIRRIKAVREGGTGSP